jgi:glycosyltransferase involved in cell wall biosynthesis
VLRRAVVLEIAFLIGGHIETEADESERRTGRIGARHALIDEPAEGAVARLDAEQLAQGIVKLLGDDRLRQDYAIAAHQHVINAFSLREMIDQYERLFTVDDTSI